MGNHRADRGPRRDSSADRTVRKPLVTRSVSRHAAPRVTQASAADVLASLQAGGQAPDQAASVQAPPVQRSTQPGKRAARPAPKPSRAAARGSRAATPTPAPERIVRSEPVTRRLDLPLPTPTQAPRIELGTRIDHELLTDTSGTLRAVGASGKRRAVKPSASRGAFLRSLPSAPILAGVAALAVSAGGAVTAGSSIVEPSSPSTFAAASALTGATDPELLEGRTAVVSRDSRREAAAEDKEAALLEQTEAAAQERTQIIQSLTVKAEKQAAKIEANQWVMPLSGYDISATFGMSSSLWSTVHTGLDFAAPYGSRVGSVANGVVTEVGYDGSYGNKIVVTHEDGTEVWYCHLSSMSVSVGEEVVGGEAIGAVGSTGNSTGSHLHLEVRPGGDNPVDPYDALLDHGLRP